MYAPIRASIQSTTPDFNTLLQPNSLHCTALNQDFQYFNANQQSLKFFPQDHALPHPQLGYEQRIFQHGIIATRSGNWHDFFNAMVWHNFPQTKIAINAIHMQEIDAQSGSQRSRIRDLLTLFDECGVVIMADNYVLDLIRNHQWQQLFVEHAADWHNGSIKIITFGHALYEKYLSPYIGMTAQALLVPAIDTTLDCFLSIQLKTKQILLTKKDLSPLPLLGIPQWHKKQDPVFYANKNYFRDAKIA